MKFQNFFWLYLDIKLIIRVIDSRNNLLLTKLKNHFVLK